MKQVVETLSINQVELSQINPYNYFAAEFPGNGKAILIRRDYLKGPFDWISLEQLTQRNSFPECRDDEMTRAIKKALDMKATVYSFSSVREMMGWLSLC